ncbi:MAG: accessory Sec system translocase SecA2, partial [Actinobacteria bacterium]|nr:accessory Sec system translocase SecA2 [Actinomycetota bacterium]
GESGRDMAAIAHGLRPGRHYEVDLDGRNVSLTEAGARAAEQALGGIDLYSAGQVDTLTQLNVALHAHALLHRDVDYIVRDGKVELINTSRGRVAVLQRWPDGLQAAVEAKEKLPVTEAGQILDSITVEALVRRYPQVCGMTATAVAVGEELREFYDLEVAVIPPNRPCVRVDEADRLYATLNQKEAAIAAEVAASHATGRPVLIGTLDIAESERLAGRLSAAGLSATVLNAKNDAEEAAVVAEAGAHGAITVSTQMAGRGTDIRLGGSKGDRGEVAAAGGLQVIGTGRYWSSRLDRQLRGRAGRQGDPGGSVVFVSLEDELVTSNVADVPPPRQVAADGRVSDPRAGWTVGHAQRVAEGANLQIHRMTWRYSSLTEIQRGVVLEQRDAALQPGSALRTLADGSPGRYRELADSADPGTLEEVARQIVLYHLDRGWAEHLAALADVREGIHLRALGHGHNPFVMALDPLSEFHAEAVRLFNGMLERVRQRCEETFRTIPVPLSSAWLAESGLKRPTATWTYLVTENPFGTDADRARGRLSRRIHQTGR